MLGVMHSHTHTSAYPSPTDVRDATAFDPFGAFHYVIVSLKHADPVLRSYRIVDGEITEERLVIADPGRPRRACHGRSVRSKKSTNPHRFSRHSPVVRAILGASCPYIPRYSTSSATPR